VNIMGGDFTRLTPLSQSARNRHAGIARLLFAYRNVDVNIVDCRMPLAWGVPRGSMEVVKLLLGRNNNDVNAGDKDGRTSLWYAEEYGNNAI
jgi:ankyrin repeat protein